MKIQIYDHINEEIRFVQLLYFNIDTENVILRLNLVIIFFWKMRTVFQQLYSK